MRQKAETLEARDCELSPALFLMAKGGNPEVDLEKYLHNTTLSPDPRQGLLIWGSSLTNTKALNRT